MKDTEIIGLRARQILDSRGNPTIEVDLYSRIAMGRASVPSGASKGMYEALEIRDGGREYLGRGVNKAVSNINEIIRPRLIGLDCLEQNRIDEVMIQLDGTDKKEKIGANAILAVSMASAKAAAASCGLPLFRYIKSNDRYTLPIPMMNVINGGRHAGNELAVQEFLIEPIGARSFSESLKIGVEVYHHLKSVLIEEYGKGAVNVGDEGGYAPPMKVTAEALKSIIRAIKEAGYTESDVRVGLDAAASEFFSIKDSKYKIDGKALTAYELEDYYLGLIDEFPILTLEDPFEQESFDHFSSINKRLKKVIIIGDDLYVTNVKRMEKGIEFGATKGVVIKPNQIGSVTETLGAIELSKVSKLHVIISHRSGETEDTFISHLAVGIGSTFIKAGAPARGERVAKYNELLRIEEELGNKARLASIVLS